jgi:hypothetical protein
VETMVVGEKVWWRAPLVVLGAFLVDPIQIGTDSNLASAQGRLPTGITT